jgi:hypothetical protein
MTVLHGGRTVATLEVAAGTRYIEIPGGAMTDGVAVRPGIVERVMLY